MSCGTVVVESAADWIMCVFASSGDMPTNDEKETPMGKCTYKGLVPRDDPMFSTGPEVFSRLGSIESSRSSPRSISGETPAGSCSASEPDPMQPAVDAVEQALQQRFRDPAKAGSQEAHDRRLQSQSTSQLNTLARNLAALMRAREEGTQTAASDFSDPEGKRTISVPVKFPSGCVFVASFSGDEFVKFPDGKVFKASDDGESLIPTGGLPDRNAAFMSEEGFLSTCAKSREFFARKRS